MSMKTKLELHKDSFTLNGEPFYLASGDMHYFRYFKGGWRRRLQLMKHKSACKRRLHRTV